MFLCLCVYVLCKFLCLCMAWRPSYLSQLHDSNVMPESFVIVIVVVICVNSYLFKVTIMLRAVFTRQFSLLKYGSVICVCLLLICVYMYAFRDCTIQTVPGTAGKTTTMCKDPHLLLLLLVIIIIYRYMFIIIIIIY